MYWLAISNNLDLQLILPSERCQLIHENNFNHVWTSFDIATRIDDHFAPLGIPPNKFVDHATTRHPHLHLNFTIPFLHEIWVEHWREGVALGVASLHLEITGECSRELRWLGDYVCDN